jgi:hypothetical protein
MKPGEFERLPVDPLSSVLSLLKPESYAIRGLNAGGNWSINFPSAEGIKCYAVHEGKCWLAMEGEKEIFQLTAGDCVLLPRGRAFRLCNDLQISPLDAGALFASVGAGQFVTLNGGGACSGLGGYFSFSGLHGSLLLSPLPPIVQLKSKQDQTSLRAYLELLMQELCDPQPGSVLMVEHLAQTLLIRALRLHVAENAHEGIFHLCLGVRGR